MRIEVDGQTIQVSNADRVVFPDDGITKGMLVEYYRDVAPVMLPHVTGRPLTLHRFPHGIAEPGFYQKRASDFFPPYVRRAEVGKKGGSIPMVVCDNAATLVYITNQNCVTPHVWLSRVDRPWHPDLVMFDLDPAGDESFDDVRDAALMLRTLLGELGLTPFVKTSGSRGLHVVAPLDRSATFDEVLAFAGRAGSMLVERDPTRLTLEFLKEDRAGRIYVDVVRNTYAQTAAAAYAVRPRPGAPVSTPISWDELADPRTNPRTWTLGTVRDALASRGDPWADLWRDARSLAVG